MPIRCLNDLKKMKQEKKMCKAAHLLKCSKAPKHSKKVPSDISKPCTRSELAPLAGKCSQRFFNSKGDPYSFNPQSNFANHELVNVGSLCALLNNVSKHGQVCQGKIQLSPNTSISNNLRGSFCSFYLANCDDCNWAFDFETDVFEEVPEANSETRKMESCLVMRTGLASRNISFVYSEMSIFFSLLGLPFLNWQKYSEINTRVGQVCISTAQAVCQANVEQEKKMTLASTIINQELRKPCFELAHAQIEKMQAKELAQKLKGIGFPDLPSNSERKRVLKLLCERCDDEAKRKVFQEKYVRIKVAADGMWPVRSYTSSARSSLGLGAVIGHLTRKPLAFAVKSKACSICSKAKSSNTTPCDHICSVNHAGMSLIRFVDFFERKFGD